ncbi:DNA helicase II [Gimesia chilikensis]|uniref:DNA 3'-5' helicase n=1 Tax=Gimesia chilikensis TaxID=2605989 RepID=A0A517W9K3_9PLAN|nr:3'-5' exonuclease [Gimesia chilikensis]QDU01932.1 DNA helicase II [Gimesia chilikensis]
MADVKLTPPYTLCINRLSNIDGGRAVIRKAKKAQTAGARLGEIKDFEKVSPVVETAVENEMYDLSDGFFLVAQLIDPVEQLRVFLFIGSLDDAEDWLEEHRFYKWILREEDQDVDFVLVTDPSENIPLIPDIDTNISELRKNLPLLMDISNEEWTSMKLPEEAEVFLKRVTTDDWQRNANGVRTIITQNSSVEDASFATDILTHAHKKEWDALKRRIELRTGLAKVIGNSEKVKAINALQNSEKFVTWEDTDSLPDDAPWLDWMLFLHAKQKEFVNKNFNGPARLRGVSGSGKTCVMVHRARYLAKKYKQNILLVTLTTSMKKLLDHLIELLCGTEHVFIKTSTVNSIATDVCQIGGVLNKFHVTNRTMAPHHDKEAGRRCLEKIINHPEFNSSQLAKIPNGELKKFIDEEVEFVKQRFLPDEYDKYFGERRVGRQYPQFKEKARSIVLVGVNERDSYLKGKHYEDSNGVVQRAVELIKGTSQHSNGPHYRSVMVDEVQDLSQLEIRLLAGIRSSNGQKVTELENGLFLVGDGAQTIYKKGFAFNRCGVDIANRSYALLKNYRNTIENLKAAYGLVSKYEFADVDEDNFAKPIEPHLSSRHGEKPFIIRCKTKSEETSFVVEKIKEILDSQKKHDELAGYAEMTEVPICVIGFNNYDRKWILNALVKRKIDACELRQDVEWQNNSVKISTAESAKGHEFHTVFIVGVEKGKIPNAYEPEEEWRREAAKMYVAMTRAREELYMTYTIENGRYASEFLASIQEECQECKIDNGKLTLLDKWNIG